MAQKLLTKEIIDRMPGPRAQENVADPIAYAKFFSCRNGWTWYATEAWQVVVDAATGEFIEERDLRAPRKPGEKIEDIIFFGKVIGIETELGNFSLKEFEQLNAKSRVLAYIERDIYWKPEPLSKCVR